MRTFSSLFYFSASIALAKEASHSHSHSIKESLSKGNFLISEVEAEAIRIERFIKKQKSRKLIEKLIDPDYKPEGYLAQLIRVPHVRD